MKKALAATLCSLICSAAVAQKHSAEPAIVDLHVTALELLHQIEAPRAQVSLETPSTQFLFAVVGKTPGANGTNFRSEVTLVNNRPTQQNVSVIYFPQNGTSCNGTVKTLQLPPQTFAYYSDFVGQVFNTTGIGSALVIGVDSAGKPDLNANIDGVSRIWTPSGTGNGTTSQSFPAQTVSYFSGNEFIYGLHTDSGFRSNVFVFNMPPNNTSTRQFTLNFSGSNTNTGVGFLNDVGPCQLGLFSIPADYGATSVTISPSDNEGGWFAVGSSVDNVTGDSWSVIARPDH